MEAFSSGYSIVGSWAEIESAEEASEFRTFEVCGQNAVVAPKIESPVWKAQGKAFADALERLLRTAAA